jgi:hypothetical protein
MQDKSPESRCASGLLEYFERPISLDSEDAMARLYELEKRSIVDRVRRLLRRIFARDDFYNYDETRFMPCNEPRYRDYMGFIYRVGSCTIKISTESLYSDHLEDEYKYCNKFNEYLINLGFKTHRVFCAPICLHVEIFVDFNADVDRWISNKEDIGTIYETLRDECNSECAHKKEVYNREMAILEARWRRSKRKWI